MILQLLQPYFQKHSPLKLLLLFQFLQLSSHDLRLEPNPPQNGWQYLYNAKATAAKIQFLVG